MDPQADKYEQIDVHFENGVATLILNRPEKRNAITMVMLAELIHAVEWCGGEDCVRAVVLRGADKGFCPGDDLGGMGTLPEGFEHRPKREVTHIGLQSSLRELPKPTIAAMHGYAFGVGLDLAMSCDFRVARDDMQIRDQRVMLRGMHAITGCAWFHPRAMGVTRAMEFLVLAKPYNGVEAAEAGMVTFSAPENEFDGKVRELAERLASGPTKAIALMKRQVYAGLNMDHGEFTAFSDPLLTAVEIKDRKEGVQAFLDKRPPRFTGQ